ncbi:helix-turn-helix domain-containing protein [Brucella suis]|uniref:Helix-turn-helix-domain containing protein AraC type n=1 Tax=Brucella suis (strain ATCC 23445 / NCTC 10510) TaxID=470137 RepID=B0CKN2_BRUSI|nr:helix-turn-helix domain-containing protein [Brucella suis]ABY37662.1 helix-turn-helix- domain containing protein AraC type [Brucella suis ATCC 23445]AIB17290.1 Transcriptional regulator, AraC family [Brucella suis bv. 2]AIB21256.1 Transcriptional regulator, AraC family [Brucella suis bv. 2]AIB24611.1 Transcriptional regulator, AraC family [Brucella suis bv. 2]AIB28009.1 Transcriptional regulator, AraC family [Brucella suis bv. 2]
MNRELFLSTDMVDATQRDDFWREAVKLIYDVMSSDDQSGKGFKGSLRSQQFGTCLIGSATSNGQNYQRTPSIIAQSDMDHYVLQAMIAGRMTGDFNGTNVSAKPGDIVILDLLQTVSSSVEAGERITIVIQRGELEKLVGWRNLHGMVLPGEAPTTRLLFEYLRGLDAVAAELPPNEALAAQEAMLTLLSASITSKEEEAIENTPANLPMRHRIITYIDENLTNPLLGPHSIMQHFHLSRSHLYRAFEPDGGVAKVIRDKRLDLAYRILIDRKGKPTSLKEIAYCCGFNDRTQFTKAFKARFELSPKEAREIGAPLPQAPSGALILHSHLSEQAAKIASEHATTSTKAPPSAPVKP